MSTSIAQLKVVQTKYVEAKDCLNVLNKSNEGTGWAGEGTRGPSWPLLRRFFLLQFPLEKTTSYLVSVAARAPACCLRKTKMCRASLSRRCFHCLDTECPHTPPSSRGSGRPSAAVCHYFHRKRITGPTDEFCILSTGDAALPSSSAFPRGGEGFDYRHPVICKNC